MRGHLCALRNPVEGKGGGKSDFRAIGGHSNAPASTNAPCLILRIRVGTVHKQQLDDPRMPLPPSGMECRPPVPKLAFARWVVRRLSRHEQAAPVNLLRAHVPCCMLNCTSMHHAVCPASWFSVHARHGARRITPVNLRDVHVCTTREQQLSGSDTTLRGGLKERGVAAQENAPRGTTNTAPLDYSPE